jgi:histidinol-phosphatase (PHP family)
LRVDLHNHTTLCNHATGSMEEYILKAIELGIDIYGFSEHAPIKNFDDGYRLILKDKDLYENSIKKLQEKYQDKIKILLGYEVDYLKGDYLLDDIKNANVDYFIGSIHYLGDWGFDNPEFIGNYQNKDIDQVWEEYFEAVKQMVETKLFHIVGHLDLIKIFKYFPTKNIKSIAKEALEEIKKTNMAIEINTSGFRKPIKEQYPSAELLTMAYELDIPITFSSDAHSIEHIGYCYYEAITLAKQIGYKECVYFENKQQHKVSFV